MAATLMPRSLRSTVLTMATPPWVSPNDARRTSEAQAAPAMVIAAIRAAAAPVRPPRVTTLDIDPEHRLTKRIVADDLCLDRIRIKTFPEVEIVLPPQGQTAKQQAGLADRPGLPSFDIGRLRPSLLVADERRHVGQRVGDRAPRCALVDPEVVAGRRH